MSDSYFLIERNERGYAEWATPERGVWTTDTQKADRYVTRVTAEIVAKYMGACYGLVLTVTEHEDVGRV